MSDASGVAQIDRLKRYIEGIAPGADVCQVLESFCMAEGVKLYVIIDARLALPYYCHVEGGSPMRSRWARAVKKHDAMLTAIQEWVLNRAYQREGAP